MAVLLTGLAMPAAGQADAVDARAGVEQFNAQLDDATRRMDNAATLALWAEDGVSLLPGSKPMVGKAAIRAFLEGVTAAIKGARMEHFEMHCEGIEVSGDLATEWCDEHQVVQLPGGKPPFDGRGRMLLVLRRDSDGRWLLLREMWISAEGQ
jgi:uncharacterized protein (TIGR02246 family)